MQFVKNSLWFIVGVAFFIVGAIFIIPALIILTIIKPLSVMVVKTLFCSFLIFAVLFRGNNKDSAQKIQQIRDMGKSVINNL